MLLPGGAAAFFEGRTFEERKQAYINDQGNRWEARTTPEPMNHAIFAWLETPDYENNRDLIHEAIGHLTSDDCIGGFQAWSNCWFTGDHPSTIVTTRILIQYYLRDEVITEEDAQRIKDKVWNVGLSNVWCAVANYHFRYLITGYLYTSVVEDLGDIYFPKPDDGDGYMYSCLHDEFTRNGNTYVGGNEYPSRELLYDYLDHMIDRWLSRGTSEDFGAYTNAQIHSVAALADFAPDETMRSKAKMLLDWLLFQWGVTFSANAQGEGHGRHYCMAECEEAHQFPVSVFYSMEQEVINELQRRRSPVDVYVTDYRQPQLLIDIVESTLAPNGEEGDDYYRIVRGRVPAIPEHERYDYVTKNFTLGGSDFGHGWELNIKCTESEYIPFKVFINVYGTEDDCTCNWGDPAQAQVFFMGQHGHQHRNAVYYTSGGNVHVWTPHGSEGWDEQSREDGWDFYREGNTAVAIYKQNGYAALEACSIRGDYDTYDAFRAAVLGSASVDNEKFITSKGVEITEGYMEPLEGYEDGDRLEIWEGHLGADDETKIVDWEDKVMTVSKGGTTLIYDFNTWTFTEIVPGPEEDDVEDVEAVEAADAPDAADMADAAVDALDAVSDAMDASGDTEDEGEDETTSGGCSCSLAGF